MIKSLKNRVRVIFALTILLNQSYIVKAGIPQPDHIVICVLENHAYQQVIGSTSAPYINHLSSVGANMVEFYGLTHPSQPNYLLLFSGDNQGCTTDNPPVGTPFSTPNLGASLINSGRSFVGYSEDLPIIGSLANSSGAYARKHSPWVNWQGTGSNQLSPNCNQTLDNFPSDFSLLPDVSFIIPNLNNDMHDGVDPARIELGDRFVYDYLSAYEAWAMNNNSLLIVLFDEDNSASANHIPCIFVGPMVTPGQYWQTGYNHYDLLRTLEDMYNLPYAGQSSNAKTIEEIWSTSTGITSINSDSKSVIYPNPVTDVSYITFESKFNFNGAAKLQIYDMVGRLQEENAVVVSENTHSVEIHKGILPKGIFMYRLLNDKLLLSSGKFVVE